MECDFCCLLRKYIGQYIRIGFVVNCASDDTSVNHIYYDGFIQRRSFFDNTISLYNAPRGGDEIFTACCEDIFELYFFENSDVSSEETKKLEINTMVEQKKQLLKLSQELKNKEAKADE